MNRERRESADRDASRKNSAEGVALDQIRLSAYSASLHERGNHIQSSMPDFGSLHLLTIVPRGQMTGVNGTYTYELKPPEHGVMIDMELSGQAMDIITRFQPSGVAQWALFTTLTGVFLLCSYLVLDSKRAGLSHIPGPFWARYTDVWALYIAWKGLRYGNKVEVQRALQAWYGDVIRTGPRSVTVLDPAAVPVIYGVRSKLDKVRSDVLLTGGSADTRLDRAKPMSHSAKLASRPVFSAYQMRRHTPNTASSYRMPTQ